MTRYFLGVILLFVVGCADDGTVTAKGKVVYEDGSAIVATTKIIRFSPIADNVLGTKKPASSNIGDDGTFDLMTKRPGDGVIKGRYAVTFAVLSNPHDPDSSIIPLKYTYKARTPFELEVSGDKEDYLFELEKK